MKNSTLLDSETECNVFNSKIMKLYLKRASYILNAKERQIIYLRFWSNMSLREIGSLTGCRTLTVDNALDSALKKMKVEIKKLIKQELNLKKEIKKCS
jgi:DNA-directed RNA polymerase specialized sigma24 family protein